MIKYYLSKVDFWAQGATWKYRVCLYTHSKGEKTGISIQSRLTKHTWELQTAKSQLLFPKLALVITPMQLVIVQLIS